MKKKVMLLAIAGICSVRLMAQSKEAIAPPPPPPPPPVEAVPPPPPPPPPTKEIAPPPPPPPKAPRPAKKVKGKTKSQTVVVVKEAI